MVIKFNFIRKKELLKMIEELQKEVEELRETIDLNTEINKERLEQQKAQNDIMKEWLFGKEEVKKP
jgi:hypothetical protein